jgi:hypothetical protein
MTTLSVPEAEQQLAAAQAVAAKERRENATREIQRLRREGVPMLKRLRALAAVIHEAQNTRLKLNGLLLQARAQIASFSIPLDPMEFPSDADIAEHARQLTLWQARQKELLAQSEECLRRESWRMEAIGLQDRVNRMYQEMKNLTAVAAGRLPGQLESGGLAQGLEDFIGHTQ